MRNLISSENCGECFKLDLTTHINGKCVCCKRNQTTTLNVDFDLSFLSQRPTKFSINHFYYLVCIKKTSLYLLLNSNLMSH